MKRHRSAAVGRYLQRGAAALEFALVSTFFLLTLLVGIIELGRVFFYLNAAAQATRLGARMAAVCDQSDPRIKERMQTYLGLLKADSIGIVYSPQGCTADGSPACRFVTVRIEPDSTKVETVIPFVPLTWTLPSFSTTLPRESMDGANGTNPVCSAPWQDPTWTSL